jgi:hypothetical protein
MGWDTEEGHRAWVRHIVSHQCFGKVSLLSLAKNPTGTPTAGTLLFCNIHLARSVRVNPAYKLVALFS